MIGGTKPMQYKFLAQREPRYNIQGHNKSQNVTPIEQIFENDKGT